MESADYMKRGDAMDIKKMKERQEQIRNFSIIAHIRPWKIYIGRSYFRNDAHCDVSRNARSAVRLDGFGT